MTKEKQIEIANKLSDLLISEDIKMFEKFDGLKDSLTKADSYNILRLMNLYYNCKMGIVTKDDARIRQKEILSEDFPLIYSDKSDT